jgi:hypothetical protein
MRIVIVLKGLICVDLRKSVAFYGAQGQPSITISAHVH